MLAFALAPALGFAPAPGHSYEQLTTTCQNATPISSKLSVKSVADCQAKCDGAASCVAVDTDGYSCYLKSHCEGTAGACKGSFWCGYRQSGPLPPPPPPPAPLVPLREAAKKRGVHIGAAGNQGYITNDAAYAKTLAEQYSLVTAENGCKWESIHPGRDRYDFGPCDVVSGFAQQHGMAFRGHNLCWGEQNPGWLTSGSFSAAELRGILENHTQTVAAHYGDGAIAWDVVNEAVSDSPEGSAVLKPTVWYPALSDYVDVAFRSTRQAYAGLLFYNDYNIASSSAGATELHPRTGEELTMGSQRKSDAVYTMVKGMKARGVPIDGVGFQLHVQHTYGAFDGVAENMARLAALGLQVHITELDVKCPYGCSLDQQAAVYRQLLRVCLAQPACTNFESWGFTDKYTWVGSSNRPLPFDEKMQAKPAVLAMLAELQAK